MAKDFAITDKAVVTFIPGHWLLMGTSVLITSKQGDQKKMSNSHLDVAM
jgi:hypothetical protein